MIDMSIKKAQKVLINQIRFNPEASGLRYKDFGKSTEINYYS